MNTALKIFSKKIVVIAALSLLIGVGVAQSQSFLEPTAAPPGGNVPPPFLHTGTAYQLKAGSIGAENFFVNSEGKWLSQLLNDVQGGTYRAVATAADWNITVSLDMARIISLCADEDGCLATLSARFYDTNTQPGRPGIMWSEGPFPFSVGSMSATGRWWRRGDQSGSIREGLDNNGQVQNISEIGGCQFTDGEYTVPAFRTRGDGYFNPGTDAFQGLNLRLYKDRTSGSPTAQNGWDCVLVFRD